MNDQNTLMVKPAVDAWNTHIKRTDTLLISLSDAQLMNEVAPGRNRGIYLLGHLVAVHEAMLPLLDLGEVKHPYLLDIFIKNPDRAIEEIPVAGELRQNWKDVNETLSNHFAALEPDEWLQRHTSVSVEDFIKEPHRNRLNILINRTNHLAYHLGQLAFLKSNTD